MLPSLKQKFNDHKIIDDIDRHLKTKLASVAKIKKILSEDKQAEFSEPKKYFSEKLISHKSSLGKKNARSLHALLHNIENVYKVDKHVLLARWANETFFGKVRPKLDGVQVLSLLSFSSKNRSFF